MLGWWRVVSLMPSSLQYSILMLSLHYQWRNKPSWYTEHEVMQTYSMKHEVHIAVLIRDVESNLKVEAEGTSETFVTTYRTTRRHNSEDHNSNHHHILNILMKLSHLTGHKVGRGGGIYHGRSNLSVQNGLSWRQALFPCPERTKC